MSSPTASCPMPNMVTFTDYGGATIATLIPALVDLYEIVYSEPPYEEGPAEVAGFRQKLPEEAARPGFSLVSAEDNGQLIGAAYGWTMSAGSWWSKSDRDPPVEIQEADKFAVMEWIVHPTRRAGGIGSQLMRLLLANRTEPYATLASDPRSLARAIYQNAGWRQVAASSLSWGPTMDLLVIKLPAYP